MNQREKVLTRRAAILDIVKSGSFTVKEISKKIKASTDTVRKDIRAIDGIHWQDCTLYYGEKL